MSEFIKGAKQTGAIDWKMLNKNISLYGKGEAKSEAKKEVEFMLEQEYTYFQIATELIASELTTISLS